MKKYIAIFIACMLMASTSFASVGIQDDGTDVGAASVLNIVGEQSGATGIVSGAKSIDLSKASSLTTDGDVTFQEDIIAVGRISASSSMASSASFVGTGELPFSIFYKTLGAGAETSALPNGTAGQVIVIAITFTHGGNWTLTPTTSALVSSIAITTGQVSLLYVDDTIGWIVLGVDGTVTVTYNTGSL